MSARRLTNPNFTIISNNCWGHEVYNYLRLPYDTPFVGLYLYAPCYIKLLENFHSTIASELRFKEVSKYGKRVDESYQYPIGVLGDDIEIQFLHYKSKEEAYDKWNRRLERMHLEENQLFFKFDDRDRCTQDLLLKFHQLPYKNKISFSKAKLLHYENNFELTGKAGHVSLIKTLSFFDIIH